MSKTFDVMIIRINSIKYFLFVCFVLGIGVGLATSAAFVALNHYFKHKRGQAVGLSMVSIIVYHERKKNQEIETALNGIISTADLLVYNIHKLKMKSKADMIL